MQPATELAQCQESEYWRLSTHPQSWQAASPFPKVLPASSELCAASGNCQLQKAECLLSKSQHSSKSLMDRIASHKDPPLPLGVLHVSGPKCSVRTGGLTSTHLVDCFEKPLDEFHDFKFSESNAARRSGWYFRQRDYINKVSNLGEWGREGAEEEASTFFESQKRHGWMSCSDVHLTV